MRLAPTYMTILAVVLLIGVAGTPLAATADIPTIPRDHYKVYDLVTLTNIFPSVTLIDQFGESRSDAVGPLYYGVVTSKNGEEVFFPELHYSWYEFHTPEPGRLVVYQNQFGEGVVFVEDGIFLLTPSLKNNFTGEPPPPADHFKCYKARSATSDIPQFTAVLDNQVGVETVEVLEPELFCNPAEKRLPDGTGFPISNDIDHLVCYRIEPQVSAGFELFWLDQFNPVTPAGLDFNRWLCVPSLKTGVTQTEESSWGKLKSIYR